jgi:SAM-dependent methyltransferase
MSQEYPKNFARFYDVIYHQQRDGVDNNYFLNEIRNTDGKILEVGAGTGRLFADALNHGADIYGLDISQSMIDVLLKKIPEEQHKRISRQNIIDFKYDFKFDLIIAPFRVIMHLQDKADQLRAVNNIYKHLNANGKFIFDVFVPDLNYILHGMKNVTDFDGEYEKGKKLKRIVNTEADLIRQTIHIHFHLEWDEDNETRQEDWNIPLRFFFRYELEHLIERSDFTEYTLSGDYEGNELNRTSKEFIIICRK